MFYQNKKFIFQLSLIFVWLCYLLLPQTVFALTPGALIYRTTSQGKMFGYTTDKLLEISNGILTGINPGHVGIYVGQGEDGEHYVVEALAGGVVKTPAKYFVNEEEGEKLLGVKIPQYASDLERFKAVKIAESLVGKKLGYDFDFKKQKGPGNGDWTCVGLVEKVYESAGISNPNNLKHLEYNPNFYAVDITPDGFDNQSVINAEGDCFAQNVEFSKIARRTNLILPLPEVIGFDAGLEHKGERYIFLPYTQFIQPSLVNERVDIDLTSDFSSQEIRGKTPTAGLFLRWSLINNPLSSLKSVISKKTEKITNLITKIFNNEPETEIVLTDLPVVPAAKAITPEKKVVINQNVNNQNKNEQNKNKQTSAKEKKNKKDNEDIEILEEDLAKEVLPTKINSATKINSVSSNANQKDVASKTSPAKTQNLATTNQETINITKTNITPPTSTVSVSKISAGIKTVSSNYNTNDNGNSNSRANSNFSSSSDSSASSNFSASANNNSALLELVINKIYATGNNDFIEIYNPTDYAIDLAEAGIRLEKSKTAEDPGLMIRIGNLKDGSFPGGTVIGAKSYYLIVRDDASPYHLNLADAIATRSEFNFTGNGYIIYLGKGAISSSADTDIIDAVGYGEAKYFQGVGPAPVINDNYFLNKTKNTGNNNLDFNLLVSSDPNIVWEDEEDNEDNNDANNDAGATNANDNSNTNTGNNSDTSDTTDTNNGSDENDNSDTSDNSDENDNSDTTDTNNGSDENDNSDTSDNSDENDNSDATDTTDWPSDFVPYVLPEPILTDNVNQFWNFSECYGEYVYSVGRFDCAIEISHNYPFFYKTLETPINGNKFTLSFYYRSPGWMWGDPRLVLNLSNDTGQGIKIFLEPALFQAEGLPNSNWRYYNSPVMLDNDWHTFSLVVNKEESYWAAYFDGEEKYRQSFNQTLANNFNQFELTTDMASVAVDELILWNRALSPEEIKANYDKAAPFAPIFVREPQTPAQLKYFWDFNEGHELINIGGGTKAIDSIKGLELTLPENSWIWRASENTGIVNKWGKNLEVEFPESLNRKDLSMSFWWRSKFYPLDGRSLIALRYGEDLKFALSPDQFRRNFFFNNQYGAFSEGENIDLPYDENWHHFVATYDSYRYELKLFIDGEEKRSRSYYWIKDGEEPNNLFIKNELNSVELDDLGIWEGALTPLQVKSLYENSK